MGRSWVIPTSSVSDVAGRNVHVIRSGIISDQAKVKYLQEYIRQWCMKLQPLQFTVFSESSELETKRLLSIFK